MTTESSKGLKRIFTLPTLIIYGVGSILGAGIYTIIGEVAQTAGSWTWVAFSLAFLVSLLTGLSYAELGSRYPQSGSEAHFLSRAFHQPWLSSLIGWLVLCACIVSMATLSHAFVGYLKELWPHLPQWPTLIGFLSLLGGINFWGIQESSRANIVSTAIEFSGLLIVILCGIFFLTESDAVKASSSLSQGKGLVNIFQGAAMAFFAFIGFEDLVNVADETQKPKRNLPYAILAATMTAGILYVIVSWITVSVVPLEKLTSSSPLLEVVKASPLPIPQKLLTFIALFAVSNTALLNSITASRLLYGMSKQHLVPKALSRVNAARKTPYVAILTIVPMAIILALVSTFKFLAGTTSMVLLLVFFMMSLSLFVLKIKPSFKVQKGEFHASIVFTVLAGLGNIFMMVFIPLKSQVSALIIILSGLIFLGSYRWYKSKK